MAPNPTRLHQLSVSRFGRTRGPILLVICVIAAVYTVFALHKRFATEDKAWPTPFPVGEPPTLVYRREDLQRIWEWEIAAGHYPSGRRSTWQCPEHLSAAANSLCSTRAGRPLEPAQEPSAFTEARHLTAAALQRTYCYRHAWYGAAARLPGHSS